jgi:hypothetical protein
MHWTKIKSNALIRGEDDKYLDQLLTGAGLGVGISKGSQQFARCYDPDLRVHEPSHIGDGRVALRRMSRRRILVYKPCSSLV